ncbi:hypothetical protein CU098_011571, partial [Rhizopus stolonifer]
MLHGITCPLGAVIAIRLVTRSLSVKTPINPSKKRKTPAPKNQTSQEMPQPASKADQLASSTEVLKTKYVPNDKRASLTRTKKNVRPNSIKKGNDSNDDMSEDGESDEEGSDYVPNDGHDSGSDRDESEQEE